MNFMRTWIIIFSFLPIIGTIYAGWHIWQILPFGQMEKIAITVIITLLTICFFANFAFNLDNMPMKIATAIYEAGTSWLFILLYIVLTFILLDIGRAIGIIPKTILIKSVNGSIIITLLLTAIFTYGYFNYMHKFRVPITIITNKNIRRDVKIAMLSDMHLGYHNRKNELHRWIAMVMKEKPDMLLICGDIVDRSIRPLEYENMAKEFRQINIPIIACLGNHEYYGGEAHSQRFYKEAGITLLRDSSITIDGINIVGRDDKSNTNRKSINKIIDKQNSDKEFNLLLDHQPYKLDEAEQAGIDFQFSGHTHYGQVWPISWITNALYEDAYGTLKKGKTFYYVTSGIGIWGGKFRIGTRSEYVIATIKKGNV